MTVLGNGQVQITNSQTGETRTVDPMQLGSISPFLANQYFAYAAQQKALNKTSAATTGSSDVLQGPDNSVIPGGNKNTVDPASFQSPVKSKPVKQQPKAPQIVIPQAAGVGSQLTQGNQLAQQPQNNTPWIGSQIANMFKVPQLNATATPAGY